MFTGFLKDDVVVLSDDGYPIVESAKPDYWQKVVKA